MRTAAHSVEVCLATWGEIDPVALVRTARGRRRTGYRCAAVRSRCSGRRSGFVGPGTRRAMRSWCSRPSAARRLTPRPSRSWSGGWEGEHRGADPVARLSAQPAGAKKNRCAHLAVAPAASARCRRHRAAPGRAGDQLRLLGPDDARQVLRRTRHERGVAGRRERAADEPQHLRVVVHDEDARRPVPVRGRRRGGGVARRRSDGLAGHGDRERERRAAAGAGALGPDAPAVRLDEPPADRDPRPWPAAASSPAPACLRKRCGKRSGAIPGPSSETETATCTPSRVAAIGWETRLERASRRWRRGY